MSSSVVLVWLVCGIAGGLIAQAKNRGFGGGFLWGLLLGPIGLLVALCMRRENPAHVTAGPPAPIYGAPGWLMDPWDNRYVRYWNGAEWTDQTRPVYA